LEIIALMEALLAEHDRIGSPLRAELVAGRPEAEVEATIRELSLVPPRSLVELHGWRQARVDPGALRASWFWPADPLNLDEAVALYRQGIEIGGITPAALDEVLARPLPVGATNTGFWRTDWFPILAGSPETYAIECSSEGRLDAPIWRVNWHPDSGFETIEVAPDLEWFVAAIVELFRAGAYGWDPKYHAIVTVDAVFEARGLGEHYRPPVAADR
jgi:hypothetical protein